MIISYPLNSIDIHRMFDLFQMAQDKLLKDLYLNYIAPELSSAAKNNLDGFRKVCKKKYAHIAMSFIATAKRDQMSCTIFEMPQFFVKSIGSFAALPKNSPYVGVLNHK